MERTDWSGEGMVEEKSLIEELLSEDAAAQTLIIKKYNSRLFTYFKSRIRGEEGYEDLVQEVFASFFKSVKNNKITRDEFIAPFIFGIARRMVFNFFYKKKKTENIKKEAERTHDPFVDFSGENDLQNERMIKMIGNCMENLKEIDKVILKEFYLKENSIGEISVLLKTSKHYVSVRKERAIKKIRNEISGEQDVYK